MLCVIVLLCVCALWVPWFHIALDATVRVLGHTQKPNAFYLKLWATCCILDFHHSHDVLVWGQYRTSRLLYCNFKPSCSSNANISTSLLDGPVPLPNLPNQIMNRMQVSQGAYRMSLQNIHSAVKTHEWDLIRVTVFFSIRKKCCFFQQFFSILHHAEDFPMLSVVCSFWWEETQPRRIIK